MQTIVPMQTIRVGYIPEHFSSPILFAQQKGYFSTCGLTVDLIPFPSGSGHLIQALTEGKIELAVGLTEAFVRGIADTDIGAVPQYQIVGTYVKSPLNWAISAGTENTQLKSADQLDGASIGVSRIGSGSYVMSFVLALQQNFQKPFAEHVVCDTFANLREAVNNGRADAFLWEYFTTKKYYDKGEIKMVGNIYTPWPSWVIVKRRDVANGPVREFCRAVSEGMLYFQDHHKEAVELITSNFDYSAEDAENWLPTVEFHVPCHQLSDRTKVVDDTLEVLQKAGVLKHKDDEELIYKNLETGLCSLDSF